VKEIGYQKGSWRARAISRREEDDNDVKGKELREALKEGITKQYTKPTGNITR
jgi:hypothetical protein